MALPTIFRPRRQGLVQAKLIAPGEVRFRLVERIPLVVIVPAQTWSSRLLSYCRFGIRTWLALVVVAAVVCLWLSHHLVSVRQDEAVHRLRAMGCDVMMEFPDRAELSDGSIRSYTLRRSRRQVVAVSGGWPWLTNKDFECLSDLPELRHLSLSNATAVSDSLLERLAVCRRLESLELNGCTGISRNGIAAVLTLPRLTNLSLEDCPQIHDDDLLNQRWFSSLKTLRIRGTAVTDRGVKALDTALPKTVLLHHHWGVGGSPR